MYPSTISCLHTFINKLSLHVNWSNACKNDIIHWEQIGKERSTMSFDGLFTHALVYELSENLIGGRVSKIQQPYENEIILRIRSNRKNHNLLLSAHPQYARIQLTEISFENPQHPPQFCMMMRKHLDGAILETINQIENDRIVEFTFKSRDELGDVKDVVLIAEIMGRHSNIILLNENEEKIIDTIRHISSNQNTYRTLLPGATYIPAPTQEKQNPFAFDGEFDLQEESTKDSVRFIQGTFQGFGKDSSQEVIYKIEKDKNSSPSEVFQEFLDPYRTKSFSPTLTVIGTKEYFTAIDYSTLDGEKMHFNSLSELMDHYYGNKAERDRVKQQANDLYHIIKNELEKNEKKIIKMKEELAQTEYADDYRVKGEILTAFLHEVSQGDTSVTLENFYQNNETIDIDLDPQKRPAENAQKYFSHYQKLKKRKNHLTKQVKLTKQEIIYLESVLTQLNVASPRDIEEVREELRQGAYIKKKDKQKKSNKKSKPTEPDTYKASDGTLIMVGKNNLQNDRLTTRTAHKNDWWLHAKDIPGSHVIIKDEEPSEKTVEEAANLAAYFSKYRLSSSVPIDLVQIKNVRKPNGAKPGYVIYEGQTTYFVTPDKNLIKKMKQ